MAEVAIETAETTLHGSGTTECAHVRGTLSIYGGPVQPEPRVFLELTVVIILVIELVYLFRGRPF
ncbi:MAG: hypothetical protein V4587_04165 [Acidobacteriota bacterium]